MSSRASIVYTPNIHIYEEVLDGEICFEVCGSKTNRHYDDPVLDLNELKDVYEQLRKFFEKMRNEGE